MQADIVSPLDSAPNGTSNIDPNPIVGHCWFKTIMYYVNHVIDGDSLHIADLPLMTLSRL